MSIILGSRALDFKQLFWIGIFVLGLIGGTLYVNCVMTPQNVIKVGESVFVVDNIGGESGDYTKVIHIVTKRLKLLTFFAISALLYRKSLVLCIPTAFLGGCFGVVISMVTLTYGREGIGRLFWYLMPHYLFYITAFCMILSLSSDLIKGNKKYGYMLRAQNGPRVLLKVFFLLLAGIMSECYVNQWFIQHFVKKF